MVFREIFHSSAYDHAELAENDGFYTYKNLLSGKDQSRAQPGSLSSAGSSRSEENALTVPLLKRDRSKRVDLCLDMLVSDISQIGQV